MKKSHPTLHDIARISGISIATVNKVLKDKKHIASDSAREKVAEALELLGYEPSRYIQSLRGEQTKTIAFIIPRHDAYFASVIDAIEHQQGSEAIRIIVMASNENAARQEELIDWFVSQEVDGIIVSPVSSQMRIAQRWRDIPMIVIDNHIEDETLPYIGLNHEEVAYKAAEHLLQQQHQRIGLLLGNPETRTATDSRMGYKTALENFKLKMDERLITYHYSSLSKIGAEEFGIQAVQQLLALKHRPSALIVANQALLTGVLKEIQNSGLHVPEDISVVTLDENNWNAAYQPQLTAAGTASEDIGVAIFKQFQSFFKGEIQEIQSDYVSAQLMIRNSTK